jgi:3-hydroxypropanoate dehydrogenase
MSHKLSAEALDQLFRTARSYNGYRDTPVTPAQMDEIWEAKATLAPLAMPANATKIMSAPVTVIIGMDSEFYNQLPDLFPPADARTWFTTSPELAAATAFRNSSLQGAYFILAARALGLDTGPMSGFSNEGVDEAFFPGGKIKSNFICTLGYGDPASIFDRLPRPAFDRFNSIV